MVAYFAVCGLAMLDQGRVLCSFMLMVHGVCIFSGQKEGASVSRRKSYAAAELAFEVLPIASKRTREGPRAAVGGRLEVVRRRCDCRGPILILRNRQNKDS